MQIAYNAQDVYYCAEGASFDSDILECLESLNYNPRAFPPRHQRVRRNKVSPLLNISLGIQVIQACKEAIQYEKNYLLCLQAAVNARAIKLCAKETQTDYDLFSCMRSITR